MAFGLEVRDASGNIIVGPATRTGFILGRVDISGGNQSGSTTDANILRGSPFYYAVVPDSAPLAVPLVSFSSSTMTWSASGGGTFIGSLFYGIR